MNIIFLDIDGVINLDLGWCSESIIVLNEIIDHTEAKIVISSDWKYEYSISTLRNIFLNQEIKGEIIGFTSDVYIANIQKLAENRVLEIKEYIKENDIDNYIAIDDLDLASAGLEKSKFVRTKFSLGLKEKGLKENCIQYLQK